MDGMKTNEDRGVKPVEVAEGTLVFYICGACKKKVLNLKYDACPKCGKRIDWSEVKA